MQKESYSVGGGFPRPKELFCGRGFSTTKSTAELKSLSGASSSIASLVTGTSEGGRGGGRAEEKGEEARVEKKMVGVKGVARGACAKGRK